MGDYRKHVEGARGAGLRKDLARTCILQKQTSDKVGEGLILRILHPDVCARLIEISPTCDGLHLLLIPLHLLVGAEDIIHLIVYVPPKEYE